MTTIGNRYVLIALAVLLSGCQSAGATKQAQVGRSGDWQAVERVGEARFRAPGAADWAEVMAWSEIPPASRLITGTGGRLILTRPGRQIVVGTSSRLRLPGPEGKARLEQTQGRVRYRISGSRGAFVVATPALDVQATQAVLEVSVAPEATEVTVEEGEAGVATPDHPSVIMVAAGGSARAGGLQHAGVMVRRDPGEDYRRVMPALASNQPPSLDPAGKRSLEAEVGASAAARDRAHAATVAAAGPAKRSGGAATQAAGHTQTADDDGRELVVVPAGFRQAPDQLDHDAEQSAAESGPKPEDDSTGAAPADPPKEPFTLFTDGLLHSLPPVSLKPR